MNFLGKKKRYIVLFVRKEQESYTFLKKVKVLPHARTVKYTKKNIHPIFLQYPSYIRGLSYFYLIDVDAGGFEDVPEEEELNEIMEDEDWEGAGQLRYRGSNLKYDAGILSFLTEEQGIRQLSSGFQSKLLNVNTIVLLIMGIVMGVFIGFFIAGFF